MHKDKSVARPKNQVGLARKGFDMEAEPEPEAMRDAADDPFRLCVLAANRGHALTALLRGKRVAHGEPSLALRRFVKLLG
jgi:hypothetical protein